MVYTDGIVEGHDSDGTERFDSVGLARAARQAGPTTPRRLADALVDAAEEANGEPLADDVALVILTNRAPADP